MVCIVTGVLAQNSARITENRCASMVHGSLGITFCALFLGPEDQTDVHFAHWRLWEAEPLTRCVEKAGFREIEVFGSVKKAPFDRRTSTDVVIAARKS